MNFRDIQDEIIALRFDESQRDRVKRWVQSRYAALWASDDWNFKRVLNANLTITGGSNTPTMLSDVASVESLYDQFGAPVPYVDPQDWRDVFNDPSETPTTQPYAYTIVAGQVYLGPTPSGSTTFKISYSRRVSHLSGTTVTVGNLSADSDLPIWSVSPFSEYDYILVIDGMMLGQQLLNDPTAYTLSGQRDDLFQAMKDDLVGETKGEVMGQWGGTLAWDALHGGR